MVLSAGPYQACTCITFEPRLRCSSTAPLAMPVVPPVYCSAAMSSAVTSTGENWWRSPSRSASLKRMLRSSWNGGTSFLLWRTTQLTMLPLSQPSVSPMLQTMIFSSWRCAGQFCTVAPKFSSTIITLAPLSWSWWLSSDEV